MNKEVNEIFEDFSKSIAAKPASSELKDIAESVGKEMLRVEGFDLTCILTIEKTQTTIYLDIFLWAKYRQMDNASYTKEEHEIMLKFKDAKRYLVNYLNENIKPETKTKEISNPTIAAFCHYVNNAGVINKGSMAVEMYCKKVCERYGLDYTDKVRQNYSAHSVTTKHTELMKTQILPLIPIEDKDQIEAYINNQTKLYQ